MTSFFSRIGGAVSSGVSTSAEKAGVLKQMVVEESGLEHLEQNKSRSGSATLGEVLRNIVEGSFVHAKWQHYIVDPVVHTFTVYPTNGKAMTVFKRVMLCLVTTLLTTLNLALIPFYIIEVALESIKLIFTAPYKDTELLKEKRYVVRFGAQIPSSICGVITAAIEGPIMGISAAILDIAKCGRSF